MALWEGFGAFWLRHSVQFVCLKKEEEKNECAEAQISLSAD